MRIVRREPGPCLFCGRLDVEFRDEHLPAESLVGAAATVLVNWVCGLCNSRLSREDVYFASHYHGAIGRPLHAIRGKKGKGARVQRKDLAAQYDPTTNTSRLRVKGRLPARRISAEFLESGIGRVELECRNTDPKRLGRCLAKMALEVLACNKPDVVHETRFDPIRDYAFAQGSLAFLPYALGPSTDTLGPRLCEIKFEDEDQWVPIALITLPVVCYAVQLSNFEDLHPLWHIAKFGGMVFDEDGGRTRRLRLNLELRDMRDRR